MGTLLLEGETTATTISGALTQGFNQVATSAQEYIVIALPIALGIFATVAAISIGVKVFKRFYSKG